MNKRFGSLLGVLIFLLAPSLFETVAAQETKPLLEFPQPQLDDTATYRGYMTRFFRDAEGNAVQISISHNTGRVVNLWADAVNESISFTARDTAGHPVKLLWDSEGATVESVGKRRYLQYALTTEVSAIEVGLFLLASMRKERDFQYFGKHLLAFDAEPYIENEPADLLKNLERIPVPEQARQLSLLNAESVEQLRSRLHPLINSSTRGPSWVVTIEQPTLDGKNLLSLELSGEQARATAQVSAGKISIRAKPNLPIHLTIKIGTDSPSLTPLTRENIFNQDFFQFYSRAKAKYHSAADQNRQLQFQRLERQVKSVELLSYQEKLMAGLPNFATYFGRDMMMSALMMAPIWSPAMLEHVIGSVLRKLSPSGEVSHEEALGGQAIRENAAEYNQLLGMYFDAQTRKNEAKADSLLARAREVIGDLQAVRENYKMLDDDFQLPVLAAKYLAGGEISPERKRIFLHETAGVSRHETRLTLLLKNLLHVEKATAPYVAKPEATNLVSFPQRDDRHWFSGSWRDSNAGYANGRFAMDINAVWAPQALEAMQTIFSTLRELGYTPEDLEKIAPELHGAKFSQYLRHPETLRQAIAVWRGAKRHFKVSLNSQQIEQQVQAKLNWLAEPEGAYWSKILSQSRAAKDGIEFLALSLDAEGRPIPVANTDTATLLFLENLTESILKDEATPEEVLNLVKIFILPYPVGLFVEGLGPLVANDAYATAEVWESFKRDHYHSPRVVWGREVNLVLLGLSKQILAAYDEQGRLKNPKLATYVHELRQALNTIAAAVEASGLKHNELWSYKIENSKLFPSRYPASCDIQLWNLTDLAVQYSLERLSRLTRQ
jgi:hypothetical protein